MFAQGRDWPTNAGLRRIAVYDEGYEGRHVMPTEYRALHELPARSISLKEYRNLMKECVNR